MSNVTAVAVRGEPTPLAVSAAAYATVTGSVKVTTTRWFGPAGSNRAEATAGAVRSAASAAPGEPPSAPLARQETPSPQPPTGAVALLITSDRPPPSVATCHVGP